MAKASEDPGDFQMLLKDFSGTMKKIWEAFVASLKEWMKNDIFCQKWSGVPHFSNCLAPTEDFDCLSCKTLVNGVCALSGAVLAEVVPSFFTGGLTTAAKYGAQGASKIAKLFKVTAKTQKALKSSKIGTLVTKTISKSDEALKLSKSLMRAKDAVLLSLKAIRTYSNSTGRAIARASMKSLSSLSKSSKAFLVETATGKAIVFSAKGAQKFGKVVFYPIENPLTVAAFKSGQRSFDKIFKLGQARIAGATGASAHVLAEMSHIESKVAKLEGLKNSQKPSVAEIQKLEQEIYQHILPERSKLTDQLFKKENLNFDEIVKELYPELEYGHIAKTIGEEKVIAAEKELLKKIGELPEGTRKEELLNLYQKRLTQGEARAQIVKNNTDYATVLKNSKLNDEERFKEALIVISRRNISEAEKLKLKEAVLKAHRIGADNGVYEYSWLELRHKHQ